MAIELSVYNGTVWAAESSVVFKIQVHHDKYLKRLFWWEESYEALGCM